MCFTLSPLLQYQSWSLIPSFVFDYLLQPSLPLCPHSLCIMQIYSLHSGPYPFVSVANSCRNSLWTHKPHCPETDRLSALFLLFQFPFPKQGLSQLCNRPSAVVSPCLYPIPGMYTVPVGMYTRLCSLLWMSSPLPIPWCQLPVPRNMIYLGSPVTTFIRIQEEFPTRQHTTTTLSEEVERPTETKKQDTNLIKIKDRHHLMIKGW